MTLGVALGRYPNELRADLQAFYGIDLDRAMAGEHGASHVAALVSCLPPGSRVSVAVNPDNVWTLERQLLGLIFNALTAVFTPKDKSPAQVGPDFMRFSDKGSTIAGMALTPEELMAELARPRQATQADEKEGGADG